MLFPIGDDNSMRQTVPIVTWTLIGLNVLVFIYQLGHPEFTYGYSVVPKEITSGEDINAMVRVGGSGLRLYQGPASVYLTIFWAMFMHGGWSHIGGNMLYLY